MNINIIQAVLVLLLGLMTSPAISDSRHMGANSTWTKNSFGFKIDQKLRHDGKAQRNAPHKNDRNTGKWSGRGDQYNEHHKPRKKEFNQNNQHKQQTKNPKSGQHDVNKRPNPNSYYPPNRWKRFKKQPRKSNGHDVYTKHKKVRKHRNTKIKYADIRHRPLYKRHNVKKHSRRNYWTPWYNTRYIAPIRRHYYPIGHRARHLPRARIRLFVGGLPYFYYTGMFYRLVGNNYIVVSAPFSAVIKNLPLGFVAFTIGLSTYYMANDTYYMWDDGKDGYVVVPEPALASQALEEATQGRLFVYPNKNQNEDLQSKDRYECHRWAVSESSVDPTLEEQDYTNNENSDYKRGITACLVARDYTVN
jgi:hypothetical protein